MNLESYLEEKLSSIYIYHRIAQFEKSSIPSIPDRHLPIIRIILAIGVGASIVLQWQANTFD